MIKGQKDNNSDIGPGTLNDGVSGVTLIKDPAVIPPKSDANKLKKKNTMVL